MKIALSLLITLACISCAADLVKTSDDQVYTISYRTGSLAFLEDKYNNIFERRAEQLCKGKKYEVLEKSRRPSTLKDCGSLVSDEYYFWVVRCVLL